MAVSTYEALLASARHGDVDEMRELLKAASAEEKDQMVNYVQEGTLNTPLHMGKRAHTSPSSIGPPGSSSHCILLCLFVACANGHDDCVKELIANGTRHVPNASGNYPLRTFKISAALGLLTPMTF